MGNIIINGFKTNKLITQGYHSSSQHPPEPPTTHVFLGGFHVKPKQPKIPVELLLIFKEYLEGKLHAADD